MVGKMNESNNQPNEKPNEVLVEIKLRPAAVVGWRCTGCGSYGVAHTLPGGNGHVVVGLKNGSTVSADCGTCGNKMELRLAPPRLIQTLRR